MGISGGPACGPGRCLGLKRKPRSRRNSNSPCAHVLSAPRLCSYLTTLAQNGAPPAIPKEYGYFFVYMIATASMVLAYLLFLCSAKRYIKKPPSGDSLLGLMYYIGNSPKQGYRGIIAIAGWITLLIFLAFVVAVAFVSGDIRTVISYFNFGLGLVSCGLITYAHLNNDYMEGIEDHPAGILTCQEARDALETVPTLLVVNVCFSIVYNQMNGPFQSQACQMDLYVGGTQLNAAFFNIGMCPLAPTLLFLVSSTFSWPPRSLRYICVRPFQKSHVPAFSTHAWFSRLPTHLLMANARPSHTMRSRLHSRLHCHHCVRAHPGEYCVPAHRQDQEVARDSVAKADRRSRRRGYFHVGGRWPRVHPPRRSDFGAQGHRRHP